MVQTQGFQMQLELLDFKPEIQEGFKKCKKCFQVLPKERFSKHHSNRDRLRGECKKCNNAAKIKSQSNNNWKRKNPEKWKAYIKDYYVRKVKPLQPTSNPKPCQCGSMDRLSYRKSKFTCFQCRRTNETRQKNKANRNKDFRKRCSKIESEHGQEVLKIFIDLKEKNKRSPNPVLLIKEYMVHKGLPVSNGRPYRAFRLSKILGISFTELKWHCQSCAVENSDPSFFDLDHIHARCKGGKGLRLNLQVLCPNCHRKKTISDVWDQGFIHKRKTLCENLP